MNNLARKLCIVGGTIFATSIFALFFSRENFLINYSPSISPGIYIRSANQVSGQFAHFPIPTSALALLKNNGGFIPTRGFLKPTLAFPPYRICYDAETHIFTVDDEILPASELAPLGPISAGCRLENAGVFVYSNRVHNSLDSRHYGSIPLNEIDFFQPFLIIQND